MKKQKPKKGILGVPISKSDRILFLINNDPYESDDEDDDSQDETYVLPPNENEEKCSKSLVKSPRVNLTKKSKSMTNDLLKTTSNTSSTRKLKSKSKSDLVHEAPLKKLKLKANDGEGVRSQTIPEIPEPNSSTADWANGLPFEILLKIFEYASHTSLYGNIYKLNNLRHVCKYWYSVGSDARLWHRIHLASIAPSNLSLTTSVLFGISFKTKENKAKDEICQKFVNKVIKRALSFSFLDKKGETNRFKFTKILDLSLMCYLNCDMLQQLLSNCDANVLKSLNLSFCKRIYLTNSDLNFFDVITKYCPKLEALDMTGIEIIGPKHKAVLDMSELCLKLGLSLRELVIDADLAGCMTSLIESCKNLEKLEVLNYSMKNLNHLRPYASSVDVGQLGESLPKLKSLRFLNCSPKIKYKTNQDVLQTPTSDFENLQEFCFSFKFQTENFLIFKILKDAKNLIKLDIRSYQSPLTESISLFGMSCTSSLEHLILPDSNLSEADQNYLVEAITNKWHLTLKKIDLSWSNISMQNLDKIIKCFIGNRSTCKLSHLNLTSTRVESTDLKALMKSIKTLKVLNLSQCRSVERNMKKSLSREDFLDMD